MNPLADLTKAPILYKIGDKTYEVSPLTTRDLGAFCRFAQYLDYYTLAAMPDVPQDRLSAVFDSCVKKRVSMSDPATTALMETPDGLIELAYLSLHHKHAELTRDDVGNMPANHIANIGMMAVVLASPQTETNQKKIADILAQLRAQDLLS